jgi:hypothetical protein
LLWSKMLRVGCCSLLVPNTSSPWGARAPLILSLPTSSPASKIYH